MNDAAPLDCEEHSGHDRTVRAIEFRSPDRIPIVFWNRDQAAGDVMLYHLSLGMPGDGSVNAWDWSVNEWGYVLEKLGDGTMGHPVAAVYPELPRADAIRVPALREAERMSAVPAFLAACGSRYRLASLDLSGFTVYTLLRGFAAAMQDFLLEPEGFAALMDRIVDFECELMRLAARHGFHGIHFADDWGTQSGLMISPAHVAATVQTALRPPVRRRPRTGTARLVSLLRRVPADHGRLP